MPLFPNKKKKVGFDLEDAPIAPMAPVAINQPVLGEKDTFASICKSFDDKDISLDKQKELVSQVSKLGKPFVLAEGFPYVQKDGSKYYIWKDPREGRSGGQFSIMYKYDPDGKLSIFSGGSAEAYVAIPPKDNLSGAIIKVDKGTTVTHTPDITSCVLSDRFLSRTSLQGTNKPEQPINQQISEIVSKFKESLSKMEVKGDNQVTTNAGFSRPPSPSEVSR